MFFGDKNSTSSALTSKLADASPLLFVYGLTLTVPTLANAPHLVCTVPAPTKRNAVALTVLGPITEDVPATVMRNHADCVMFCDADSGADLL